MSFYPKAVKGQGINCLTNHSLRDTETKGVREACNANWEVIFGPEKLVLCSRILKTGSVRLICC